MAKNNFMLKYSIANTYPLTGNQIHNIPFTVVRDEHSGTLFLLLYTYESNKFT